MHKSLGNIVEPQEVLKTHAADALRYWTVTSTIGEDVPYDEDKLSRGHKLLVKLWNTARFVSMHFKGVPKRKPQLEIIDKWILSRLAETQKNYIKFFGGYEIAKARKEIELFFLHEFCDFYVEMVKYRLYSNADKAAKWILYTCLLAILKMLAPIMPHITEEIYKSLYKGKSIHITGFDRLPAIDKKASESGKIACEVISAIRKWKQKRNLSLGKEVERLTVSYPKSLKAVKDVIAGTMRIKNLKVKKGTLKIS